jgi:hypothetical protein
VTTFSNFSEEVIESKEKRVFENRVTFVTATTNNNTHVAWGTTGPGYPLPLCLLCAGQLAKAYL